MTLLKNASGDRRMKIVANINLTEDGAYKPEFVAAMFDAVAKDESAITLAKSSAELEGTTVVFYATNKSKGAAAKATACTLRTFSVTTKKARGKDISDVMLSFSIYAPASKSLWDWGYDLQGGETFAEFAPSQMTFSDASTESAETETPAGE